MIDPNEIEYVPYKSPGGQQVGTYTGITIRHIPSNITVTVETERSQFKNKDIALNAILGAITSKYYRRGK